MKRNNHKFVAAIVGAILSLAVSAATETYSGVTYTTSGCTPGVWTSDFDSAKSYADKNNVPLLVFWGSKGCGYCARMISRGLTVDPFLTWASQHKIAMVFVDVPDSETSKVTDVKKFAMNSSGNWPYMRIYWKKTDGSVVNVGFTGRKGSITNGGSGSESTQLVTALNYYVGSWSGSGSSTPTPTPTPTPSAYAGGDFLVPGTAAARLEMIKGMTHEVVVPLVRTNTTNVAYTNVLTCGASPTTGGMTYTVIWKANQTSQNVVVDVANFSSANVALTLMDGNKTHSTSTIYSVDEPANSVTNPAWYGDEVDFGEWTTDLETALGIGMDGKGTLVLFTGALWCPWCIGIDNYVFNTNEFKSWAKENQLALAVIDNVRRSANDSVSAAPYAVSTVPNGAAPSLFSYAVGSNGRSGAAYLSRKGISEREAALKLQENHNLGYLGGTYCAPEALRTGYPTLILLDPEGNIKGRFVYQCDESKKDSNGAYIFDKTENLARLKDFIKLLDNDVVAEKNKYASTTALSHTLGATASSNLSVCENSVVYKLNGFNGKRVTFTKTRDTAGKGLTMTVLKAETISVAMKDASGKTTATKSVTRGATVTSSANGTLIYEFPTSGTYYLKVQSYADASAAKYGTSGTTTTVAFKSELTPDPTENPYVDQSTSATLGVYNSARTALAGTLAVSSTSSGRITAKFYNAATKKTITLRGKWGEVDFYGLTKATLVKGDVTVALTMNAKGVVSANITSGTTALVSSPSLVTGGYSKFAGKYTVALPVVGLSGKDSYPSGTGYMLIDATSSQTIRKGRVACKILLPDGKSMTASAYLELAEDGWARLSVLKRSTSDNVSIALKIRPNASTASSQRAVVAQSGVVSSWSRNRSGISYSRKFGIYGSIYRSSDSLVDCCGAEALEVAYDTTHFADSARYGAIKSILADGSHLTVSPNSIALTNPVTGFTVTVRKNTGVVTGRTRMTFANGKSKSVSYKGVIVPGWEDCGCGEPDTVVPLTVSMPFVYGTCYYSDRVNSRTTKRSFAIGFKLED